MGKYLKSAGWLLITVIVILVFMVLMVVFAPLWIVCVLFDDDNSYGRRF